MTVGCFQNSNMLPGDPGRESLYTTEILRSFAELPPQKDKPHTAPHWSLLFSPKTILDTRSFGRSASKRPSLPSKKYWWAGSRWKRQILKGSENCFIWFMWSDCSHPSAGLLEPEPFLLHGSDTNSPCNAVDRYGPRNVSEYGGNIRDMRSFRIRVQFGIFDFKNVQSSRNTYYIQTATRWKQLSVESGLCVIWKLPHEAMEITTLNDGFALGQLPLITMISVAFRMVLTFHQLQALYYCFFLGCYICFFG